MKNGSDPSDDPLPAAYIPTPSFAFYRWSAIVNSDYVSVFVLPPVSKSLREVSPFFFFFFISPLFTLFLFF